LNTEAKRQKHLRSNAQLLLEDSIGYKIRRCHRQFLRLLQVRIAPFGVTVGMWYFLRALWEEDGLKQVELGARTGVVGPTTVSAVEKLERMGLIERVRSSDDRRVTRVFLTKEGRRLEKKLMPIAVELFNIAAEGFTHAEARQTTEYLDRMLDNLNRALR